MQRGTPLDAAPHGNLCALSGTAWGRTQTVAVMLGQRHHRVCPERLLWQRQADMTDKDSPEFACSTKQGPAPYTTRTLM